MSAPHSERGSNPVSGLGERALIRSLQKSVEFSEVGTRPRGFPQICVGIGDDCAVLRAHAGDELTVTTDLLLETTHFRRDWHSPESAGHRCLARGLSDLAAMGSRPLAAFLSVAIPAPLVGQWFPRFLRGLLALAAATGVPLAGGDTAQAPSIPAVSSGLFTADIVLLGSAPRGRSMLRSGARPGDRLYVTGSLGGSAAELAQMAARPGSFRRLRSAVPGHPQLFPTPRLAQGLRLAKLASAALDLSDGLSTDLTHLCESSGVRAVVHAAALPVHALARRAAGPLALALHGGEDYELLFTAPPDTRIPRSIAGVSVTCIGHIVAAEKRRASKSQTSPSKTSRITLVAADGHAEPLAPLGWQHFHSSPLQPVKPRSRVAPTS